MRDPDVPSDPDQRVEQLLDGISPGDPLSDLVEQQLNLRPPVPIDEEEVAAAVDSALTRIGGEEVSAPGRVVGRWTLLGLGLAAAMALFLVRGQPTVVPTAAESPSASLDAQPGLEIRAGSDVRLHDDVVWLARGVVSVHHETSGQGAHSVRLTELDVQVDPIGTVYYAGSRGDVAAIRVTEGRVRLTSPTQGHLGEVEAGSWAIMARQPTTKGIALHRVEDGPFDARSLGIAEGDLGPLLADVRWMALPLQTRAAILGGSDVD